ncbi:unnamed protein product [Urochloa humidicola]
MAMAATDHRQGAPTVMGPGSLLVMSSKPTSFQLRLELPPSGMYGKWEQRRSLRRFAPPDAWVSRCCSVQDREPRHLLLGSRGFNMVGASATTAPLASSIAGSTSPTSCRPTHPSSSSTAGSS